MKNIKIETYFFILSLIQFINYISNKIQLIDIKQYNIIQIQTINL